MPRDLLNQRHAGTCPLCGRQTRLTFHHLIPRKMHRRAHFKKQYTRTQLHEGVYVCRLCHDGIHDRYDEMTLAKQRNTLAALRDDPELQTHYAWVARQRVS